MISLLVEGYTSFFKADWSAVFVCEYGADLTSYSLRDGFYPAFGMMALEIEVLLGVGGFEVNICDNLAILIFHEDV